MLPFPQWRDNWAERGKGACVLSSGGRLEMVSPIPSQPQPVAGLCHWPLSFLLSTSMETTSCLSNTCIFPEEPGRGQDNSAAREQVNKGHPLNITHCPSVSQAPSCRWRRRVCCVAFLAKPSLRHPHLLLLLVTVSSSFFRQSRPKTCCLSFSSPTPTSNPSANFVNTTFKVYWEFNSSSPHPYPVLVPPT